MSHDPAYDLPVSFYFKVSFKGASDGSKWEVPFQEVSGIKTSIDVEEVREGGENRFIHKLPKQAKQGSLVLKAAVQPKDSPLLIWCKQILESDFSSPLELKDVDVMLLNPEGEALMYWFVRRAYPVSLEIGGFNAVKNEVAVETVELAYTFLTREK